jgi:vacuolar protein sorting-associated protein 45
MLVDFSSLLGLNYNRVSLKSVPGIKSDLEEVVLSCTQDLFFAKNRYANFGDLGSAVKELLDEYQKSSKLNEKINSIEDMQKFMERYPHFRSTGINVSKHVAIISELARLTDVCRLLDISQFEQEMVCSTDHSSHKKTLIDFLSQPKIAKSDKLRLSIIYLLKYEGYNEINELKVRLTEAAVSNSEITKLHSVLNYAGENQRAPGLFTGGNNLVAQFQKALVNLNGVENVYTQHEPLLSSIIDYFAKNRQLKDSSYPNVMNQLSGKPTELFVFIAGGATFEEATKVAEFNAANQGI